MGPSKSRQRVTGVPQNLAGATLDINLGQPMMNGCISLPQDVSATAQVIVTRQSRP